MFTFTDRNGQGATALGHNSMMPHSIRGKVSDDKEGPRYCVACHLTDEGLDEYGDDYANHLAALQTGSYDLLDFDALQEQIGENTGNTLNSPIWVHMVVGLGSGLFLADEFGCPVNPLDENADRFDCNDAPSNDFDPDNVAYDLDRIVDEDGNPLASNTHPLLDDTGLSGPMDIDLILKLTDPNDGIILDSWFDAEGENGGSIEDFIE